MLSWPFHSGLSCSVWPNRVKFTSWGCHSEFTSIWEPTRIPSAVIHLSFRFMIRLNWTTRKYTFRSMSPREDFLFLTKSYFKYVPEVEHPPFSAFSDNPTVARSVLKRKCVCDKTTGATFWRLITACLLINLTSSLVPVNQKTDYRFVNVRRNYGKKIFRIRFVVRIKFIQPGS